ncbi:hypothetical protein ACGFS9_03535 [Streptomyces sp. NPDC048566]|uniref:hypothetical protein n=1 Tax=Streptomyces sp. NPDC048566 TaxID=3365569 RepID=UPI003714B81B
MIPAMPAVSSRSSAYPALRFGRLAAMGAVALLILVAGVWASWGTAQHVMLGKGRERGTMAVTACSGGVCTGPFRPTSPGARARERVRVDDSPAVREGRTYTVTVKPGGDEVVRGGPAGLLYAWSPLAGALLLASVVVAGGLRLPRTAWAMAGTGLVLLTAAWVAL